MLLDINWNSFQGWCAAKFVQLISCAGSQKSLGNTVLNAFIFPLSAARSFKAYKEAFTTFSKHTKKLSLLFQKDNFHFSHAQSVLLLCQKEIKNIADLYEAINSLKLDRKKISKF